MSILTLKEAGSELILNVVTAEIVEGKFGSQVKFTDGHGDVLFVPESSVARQLDRCGVGEVEELSGRLVHFSRSLPAKNGTIYWNIDKALPGESETKAPKSNGKPPIASALPKNAPKTADAGPPDDKAFADSLVNGSEDAAQAADLAAHTTDTPFDQMVLKYDECVRAAQDAWGNDMSGEALVAAAATLFIARNQKGI